VLFVNCSHNRTTIALGGLIDLFVSIAEKFM